MKAITLHQPFAQLIADRRKRYETRSWAPPPCMVGNTIAIHAAKKFDEGLMAWAEDFGYEDPTFLPLGAIVCTARLVAWHQLGAGHGESNANWYVSVTRTVGTDDAARMIDGKLVIREDR